MIEFREFVGLTILALPRTILFAVVILRYVSKHTLSMSRQYAIITAIRPCCDTLPSPDRMHNQTIVPQFHNICHSCTRAASRPICCGDSLALKQASCHLRIKPKVLPNVSCLRLLKTPEKELAILFLKRDFRSFCWRKFWNFFFLRSRGNDQNPSFENPTDPEERPKVASVYTHSFSRGRPHKLCIHASA